jgi:hypothetical protein
MSKSLRKKVKVDNDERNTKTVLVIGLVILVVSVVMSLLCQ